MADRLHRTLVAGDAVRFKLTGVEDLEAKLQSLPQKLARKAIRESLRPAAQIIKRSMESLVHKASGFLASQITLRVSTRGQDQGKATIGISTKENPRGVSAQFEALYNEFGTRKMGARPFIRPAFDATADQALETIIRKLKEGLEEAAR